ncbi:hypothetical protein BpHYR1_031252 [Brachionus plicatilis]|uniref:Uncharacterized protein n=1 Tax=Brachionus plicatilis TaxID=10195 RepID=A0A3M7RZZ0_BRAPC|nr:hypothetical protein BpHYR1_031252 [Brachionus plicatilis]
MTNNEENKRQGDLKVFQPSELVLNKEIGIESVEDDDEVDDVVETTSKRGIMEKTNKIKSSSIQISLPTHFVLFNDAWQLFHQIELWRNRSYTENYQQKQWNMDPEKSLHNPNLYAIWNSKHYAMKITVDTNPFNSSFFIYTDIGAWRKKHLTNWPDTKFVGKLGQKLRDKILYGQINKLVSKEINLKKDTIQGGFIAGSKSAVQYAANAYYGAHDDLYDKGLFIGKEQTIMNYVTYVKKFEFISKLRTWSIDCSTSYDNWFFYQYFFAHQNQYPCANDKFSLIF